MTQPTRSIEHNEFARHRTLLMFADHLRTTRRLDLTWSATVHEGTDPLADEVPAMLRRKVGAADGARDI